MLNATAFSALTCIARGFIGSCLPRRLHNEKDDDLKDAFIGKGRKRGLQEGREIEKEETAINMLKDGLTPEVVQKYTKLPFEKLKIL